MITLIILNYLRNLLANISRMNFYLLYKSLHLIAVISGWPVYYIYQEYLFHSEADHEAQKRFLKLWKESFIIL